MNNKEIIYLVLRITAFIVFLNSMDNAAQYALVSEMTSFAPENSNYWGIFYGGLLPGGIAVFTWIKAENLTKYFTLSQPREQLEDSDTINSLQTTAFTILGVYILAAIIPEFTEHAFLTIELTANMDFSKEFWGSTTFYYIARLLIGVWLLFNARGLRGLLVIVREAGRPKMPSNN